MILNQVEYKVLRERLARIWAFMIKKMSQVIVWHEWSQHSADIHFRNMAKFLL